MLENHEILSSDGSRQRLRILPLPAIAVGSPLRPGDYRPEEEFNFGSRFASDFVSRLAFLKF
jgi:hypothetical protein